MPKKTKTIPLFFIKVYEFLNDYDLSPADKILLGVLNNCRGECCKLNNEQLCLYSGISLRQINTSLKKLSNLDLIDKEYFSKYRKIKVNRILIKQRAKEKPNFIKVYSSVLMDFNLTFNEKLIYSIIRGIHESPNKQRYLISKEVCQLCGCSISAYYTSINKLTDLSYLRKKTNKNQIDKRMKYNIVSVSRDLWPKKQGKMSKE